MILPPQLPLPLWLLSLQLTQLLTYLMMMMLLQDLLQPQCVTKLQTRSLLSSHNQTCPYKIRAHLLQQKDNSIRRLHQLLHGLLIVREQADTALHELVPIPLHLVQLVTNTVTLRMMFVPSSKRQEVKMVVFFASMCSIVASVGIELMHLHSANNMPWEHGRRLQLSASRRLLVFSDDICMTIMPILGSRDAINYAFLLRLKMPSEQS
jgi:hypothetical protein